MWTHSTRNSRRASNFSLRAGAALLVAAVMLTSCAPAYGQWGNSPPRNGSNGGYRVERQVFDSGYQDGYRQGRDDARDGDRFNPRGQREYRNADNGRYRSNDARRVYRQGFEQGYEEGYRDARGRRYQRRR
jgi:hypothetical protein